MFIDELIQNEYDLQSYVQAYLGDWEIVALLNGWTDGPGYGGEVGMDGGARGGNDEICCALLVNEDYPVYVDTYQIPDTPLGLSYSSPSGFEYDGYHYHYYDVAVGDIPTGENTDYVEPYFTQVHWGETYGVLPDGYRHILIDELL